MKDDPLHQDPVRAISVDDTSQTEVEVQDARPIWLRLLTSLRPSVSIEKDKKTGKVNETFEIKGHVDF